MRPSKPSVIPMTRQPYFWMAHLVAARITAFNPGQSPPPVEIPIVRMSFIGMVRKTGYCAAAPRRKHAKSTDTQLGAVALSKILPRDDGRWAMERRRRPFATEH